MTDQFDGLLTDFSDEVLVDSAMLGDHAAFDVIVRRYGPHLYRFARRLLASESDVDDIVQETCVAAWRQLPGFSGARAPRPGCSRSVLARSRISIEKSAPAPPIWTNSGKKLIPVCVIRAKKSAAQHFSTPWNPNSIACHCVSVLPGSCEKWRA